MAMRMRRRALAQLAPADAGGRELQPAHHDVQDVLHPHQQLDFLTLMLVK